MNGDDFEARMRQLEYFHALRLLPGTWTVLRTDGRSFSRFTESRFDKPFDERFHQMMRATAQALLEGLGGLYAYTESDEISVLFPPGWAMFDRELEKVVSVSAGIASAAFTHAAGEPAHFDSRVWVGVDEDRVVDYYQWRQTDATRCALNGWCYWTLRKEGQSVAAATAALENKSVEFKHELLFARGINFNDLPLWQRRGVGIYWETFQKQGFNPKTEESVIAERRRVKIDLELPMKEAYSEFLRSLLAESKRV
jgi:tRNA(His) guanylyltransferase